MYSTQQIQYLEDVYSRQRYISKIDRQAITRHLNLGDRQVKIWFQNRRMKSKREMEEKVLSRTPDESAKSDATLESRSSDASDHVFSDIMTTIQDDVGTENSNYQLPTYTPPRQEQFISSTYCPNNWNFQQNDLLGFYGDVQYPTEYYPTYFDHNSFQYSAAQNLGSEANSAKGCGSATTYYKFW
ncbi:Homeobox protein DBX2 [Eumeta japonica]|uniref:Homeobox protein DBX2 n=1 Tax=Eumeta variegata TaxID=151549 RepID=A0A4C1VML8_EUMVA|nr:Homeobox protein DBX2 [Eumeta japonica]